MKFRCRSVCLFTSIDLINELHSRNFELIKVWIKNYSLQSEVVQMNKNSCDIFELLYISLCHIAEYTKTNTRQAIWFHKFWSFIWALEKVLWIYCAILCGTKTNEQVMCEIRPFLVNCLKAYIFAKMGGASNETMITLRYDPIRKRQICIELKR